MGHTRTPNYQLQVQMKDDPEGRLTLIGADTQREIEVYKYHIDVVRLYVWPQTARGRKALQGFDYIKLENGLPDQGFSLAEMAREYFEKKGVSQ